MAGKRSNRRVYATAIGRRLSRGLDAFAARYFWWEVCLQIIGLACFVAIVVILFLPMGSGPERIEVSGEIPPAGSPEFVRTLAAELNLPVEQAPPIQTFQNGDAFLKA
ncbi:MAG: hypothetical protein JO294_04535, partial [Alphaproteobacteria bacterium]|nr:hypothetical protein [Alphaproteobacteria bacterium]